jgi:hypothetical protein
MQVAAYVSAPDTVRPRSASATREGGSYYVAEAKSLAKAESLLPNWQAPAEEGATATTMSTDESASVAVRRVVEAVGQVGEIAANVNGVETRAKAELTGEDEVGFPKSVMALLLALIGLVAVTRRHESDTAPEGSG